MSIGTDERTKEGAGVAWLSPIRVLEKDNRLIIQHSDEPGGLLCYVSLLTHCLNSPHDFYCEAQPEFLVEWIKTSAVHMARLYTCRLFQAA